MSFGSSSAMVTRPLAFTDDGLECPSADDNIAFCAARKCSTSSSQRPVISATLGRPVDTGDGGVNVDFGCGGATATAGLAGANDGGGGVAVCTGARSRVASTLRDGGSGGGGGGG